MRMLFKINDTKACVNVCLHQFKCVKLLAISLTENAKKSQSVFILFRWYCICFAAMVKY